MIYQSKIPQSHFAFGGLLALIILFILNLPEPLANMISKPPIMATFFINKIEVILLSLTGSFQNEYTIKVTGTQYNNNRNAPKADLYPTNTMNAPKIKITMVVYSRKSWFQVML